jgi:hypothetical protein
VLAAAGVPVQAGEHETVARLPGGALDLTPEDADLVAKRQ